MDVIDSCPPNPELRKPTTKGQDASTVVRGLFSRRPFLEPSSTRSSSSGPAHLGALRSRSKIPFPEPYSRAAIAIAKETMKHFELVPLVFLLIVRLAASQQCSTAIRFNNGLFRSFATCVDLHAQGAKLAWTYMAANNTLSVAFSGTASSPSGWVGWGINPAAPTMIGTSALVAFQASNGTTLLDYKLTAATQGGQLPSCSKIDLVVLDRDVSIDGTDVNLFAVIQLKPNQTSINHVWNRGPGVTDFKLQAHPQDTNSLRGTTGSIDVSSGTVATSVPPHQKLKNAHGFVNAVGWGILLPLGAMSARYVRSVQGPAWFYLHVFFQATGYLLGLTGWAIGLRLGSYSKGVVHRSHRSLGITLFVFATLQAIGGLLRPKLDHKHRRYFNIVHPALGYLILILSFINIFKGLDILQPKDKWRRAYIAILVVLACISVVLEVIKWIQYLRKRRRAAQQLPQKPVFDGDA